MVFYKTKETISVILFTFVASALLATLLYSCENPTTGGDDGKPPPLNVEGVFTGPTIELTWDASVSGEETGYELWRSKNSYQKFIKIATLTNDTKSYSDSDFELDNVYMYKVRGIFEDTPGEDSKTIRIEAMADAPRELTGDYDGSAVELNWLPSVGGLETGYEVWRSFDNDYNFTEIGTVGEGQYTYTDLDILPDELYYYKVRTVYDGKPGRFSDATVTATYRFLLWISDEYLDTIYRITPDFKNIISSFPSPSTWPGSLAWDGSVIYVRCQDGLLYKMDATSGEVLASFELGSSDSDGLGWDGVYILWSAWAYPVYNYIIKTDPETGLIVDSFDAPGLGAGGVAWDGNYIWNVDVADGNIYKLNPDTGAVISSYPHPIESPECLDYDGAYFWLTNNTRYIYRVDIENAVVISSFYTPSPYQYPGGISVERNY